MDTHSSHLTAPNRSRTSPSQSSATSSIHKRKIASDDHAPPFPPSSFSADTRDGALTSNEDLESISARGGGADSDDSDDAAVDDDEDFDNESSMCTFTAARLENSGGSAPSSARNSKLKTENNLTVKMENLEGGNKDGSGTGGNAVGSTVNLGTVPGIVVKEDTSKIFTENVQTSGAYIAREENLKREVSQSCLFV